MNILGVSCFYHDSAACLIRDGVVRAACSEERFTRIKNDADFPIRAVNFCLQQGGITSEDLDYVAFYEKPFLKFHRVLWNHLVSYPFSFRNFLASMPHWLQDRLVMPLVFQSRLGLPVKVFFVPHHLSHAASAFFASGLDQAAVLTADGVGEWGTLACAVGKGNDIAVTEEIRYPDSLGLVYTAVTSYLGFRALEGEGTVMGLAALGSPSYYDAFLSLVRVHDDASFSVDQRFFGYFNRGSAMYTRRFVKTFGKPRSAKDPIEKRHCDMAATVQKLTGDILAGVARRSFDETKLGALCLAGGVALNCVANSRMLEETPFSSVYVQPAAGDAGGALGAAAYAYHSILGRPRAEGLMPTAYLGPEYPDSRVRTVLSGMGRPFKRLDDRELFPYVSGRIAQRRIVGWFQGRMEFGPRALGNRSILADPRDPGMKDLLNERVKHRESFRPYAPVVQEESAAEYFDAKQFSPFMLMAARVLPEKRNVIPAVTHVDNTARVQTVSRSQNERLWLLIESFEKITGVPVLLNTSFNVKGEPIVCSPEDAIRTFADTSMDMLVLGNYILEK